MGEMRKGGGIYRVKSVTSRRQTLTASVWSDNTFGLHSVWLVVILIFYSFSAILEKLDATFMDD